ncbi:hypothetical protein F8M41_011134 [Gigaspora margarita]|uniref:Uncharacterized protein n=1 Tax=Gigaspora margarita TaxID=4874 RepID=A0A8H4A1W7_GIGMA|nr:hypothetical protein F8M41_011134 [Gigaspora margarita]
MLNTIELYQNRIGAKITKDRVHNYQKAAINGDAKRMTDIGYCYQNEILTRGNKIVKWYFEYPRDNNLNRQYNLKFCS